MTAGLTPDAADARAVAVTLPGTLIVAIALGGAVWRWEGVMPPLGTGPEPRPLIQTGCARWPLSAVAAVVIAFFAIVPIGSLVWKAGASGNPEHWSGAVAIHFLEIAGRSHTKLIACSLAAAAAAGFAWRALAIVSCWLARDSRVARLVLVAVVALAWATPGPVVGAGLRSAIGGIVDAETRFTTEGPLRQAL